MIRDIFEKTRERFVMEQKDYVNFRLKKLGWSEKRENEYGCEYLKYEKIDDGSGYWHKVAIVGKTNGPTTILSYDPYNFNTNQMIGNACVGLSACEARLFYERMRIYIKEYKRTN